MVTQDGSIPLKCPSIIRTYFICKYFSSTFVLLTSFQYTYLYAIKCINIILILLSYDLISAADHSLKENKQCENTPALQKHCTIIAYCIRPPDINGDD